MTGDSDMRVWLAERLDLSPAVVDRLAAALGIAMGAARAEGADVHPEADAFSGGPSIRPRLVELGSEDVERDLSAFVAAGRERLAQCYAECDEDVDRTLAALVRLVGHPPAMATTAATGAAAALSVPVGVGDQGGPASFVINQEAGHQTNGNTRITGQPGVGKSQFLMHLLAAAAQRRPGLGIILLDYKGDLSSEQEFVRACGASVIRPERRAIPINPFQVPEDLDRRLVPTALAETVASLGRGIGDVQRMLLRKGIEAAYEASAKTRADDPGSRAIASAVTAVYEAEARPLDSVSALLQQLGEYGLFAEEDAVSAGDFLRRRWVIDLSGLQDLRDLVAFVLLSWVGRTVTSLGDAALGEGQWRSLRCVVAIDEAHHYIGRRCRPLLELLRVGRSKGVPVVLASQSLQDFKAFTELEEFLPNNFVLRQGRLPEAATLQAALRLDPAGGKAAVQAAAGLEQFRALSSVDPGHPGDVVKLHGFFEGGWRP